MTSATDSESASAIGIEDDRPGDRAYASARTPVRARGNTDSSTGRKATGGDRSSWLRAAFTPPEIWGQSQPPIREIWYYVRYGPQLPESGFLRVLSILDGILFGIPSVIVSYYAGWIFARASRRYVALLLYVVLAHTSVGLPWPHWLP